MKESLKNKAVVGEIKAKALTDENFKKKLLANPTATLRDAGAIFDPDIEVKIVQDSKKTRHIVLPFLDPGKLSDEAMAAIAAAGSTATTCDVVQTTEVATTQTEAAETTTTQHAEAETTVVAVAEIVLT